MLGVLVKTFATVEMKLHRYSVKERNRAKNKNQNIRNFSSCVWSNLESCNSEFSNRRQQPRPQGAFARHWRWDPPPKPGKSLRVPWGRGWMIQHFYELVNKRIYWYNNFSSFTNNKTYPSLPCVKETIFLDVILYEHLSWKPHILSVSKKISKSIGIIWGSQ